MEQLFIFPFNGNGLEALLCIQNQYDFLGFIDDTPEKINKTEYGYMIFDRKILKDYPKAKLVALPGSPKSFHLRKSIISNFNIDSKRFTNLIHPNATVSPFSKIGYNVVIMAGVVITANSVIGNHVCILPNTVIHHDSNVGDYSLLGSNVTIAGYVNIGENCYIGSGVSVINGVEIGSNSLIGIGTNVIRNINSNSKVVGNPGRNI
jgi:sugar O-acyltransferase (sialic acid O-acetyltransferase NeuD family)